MIHHRGLSPLKGLDHLWLRTPGSRPGLRSSAASRLSDHRQQLPNFKNTQLTNCLITNYLIPATPHSPNHAPTP